MKNLTPEMIEKAKAAKTAEELLELAKANGVEMTADEAKTYFAQINPKSGELDDDALDAVAGGGGCFGQTDADVFPEGSKMRRKKGPCYCGNNVWIAKYEWFAGHESMSPTCSNCGNQNGSHSKYGTWIIENYEMID